MTKEQLENLSLAELRDLAKEKDIKGISSKRKSELVELLVEPEPEPQPEIQKPNDMAFGILEVLSEGYGFLRGENYLSTSNDVYVSPYQIRHFNLKTGDMLTGLFGRRNPTDKYGALLRVNSINGGTIEEAIRRPNFESLTPIFPDHRIHLLQNKISLRMVDLLSPIGKGQRGMIVSPPKAGKTTLLKDIALSVQKTNPEIHLIILLIDERPEEVTDIKESVGSRNTEVIYSTFDELPEHHIQVSEMVIERAKRLVEHGEDVMVLLDSITRLARAYNLTCTPSGKTLTGGLDPSSLHMPKKFFGAARNVREGGSLTILATALVNTGSKMDDVVYEEFKGTGNMELVLSRRLQERRVFPAIDIQKSGTRREDLLLNADEMQTVNIIRRAINDARQENATDNLITLFQNSINNNDLIQKVKIQNNI
ncbi:MAG: transcription termination factor Rho [Faecalicoccus sp.]|nr:transcription termination factor Rho [Faecalicoccus sp.]